VCDFYLTDQYVENTVSETEKNLTEIIRNKYACLSKLQLLTVQNGWLSSEYSTVKSVYKVHSSDPENVAFMSTCPLYTG